MEREQTSTYMVAVWQADLALGASRFLNRSLLEQPAIGSCQEPSFCGSTWRQSVYINRVNYTSNCVVNPRDYNKNVVGIFAKLLAAVAHGSVRGALDCGTVHPLWRLHLPIARGATSTRTNRS